MKRMWHAAACLVALIGLPAAARAGQGPADAGEDGNAQPAAPKIVEEGLFPKSIRIPGTDLSLGIGGYVKVDFIQDFSAIGNVYEFKANTIPADGTAAAAQSGQTTIHARETRFNLDVRSDGSGGHHFRAFVEGDFFGDDNSFRLRHAYGEFGAILGGQTWSTFQDISARPLTVDFEGPDGEVFIRQPMIRFTQTDRHELDVGRGRGATDAAVRGAIRADGIAPQPDAGHSRLRAIPARLRARPGRGSRPADPLRRDRGKRRRRGSRVGCECHLRRAGGGRNLLQGQFAIGEGIAHYIEALNGQNLDATLSADNRFSSVRSQAISLGYTIHWRQDLKSGLAYSTASVDDAAGLGPGVIDRVAGCARNLSGTRPIDWSTSPARSSGDDERTRTAAAATPGGFSSPPSID